MILLFFYRPLESCSWWTETKRSVNEIITSYSMYVLCLSEINNFYNVIINYFKKNIIVKIIDFIVQRGVYGENDIK